MPSAPNDPTDERLADWFKSGIEAADVTALSPLTQSRPAIQALIALFTGTEAAVLIRLLVLREVAARGGDPYFSAAELRNQFPYLDEAKLENLIGRLRVHGLLAWDADTSRYGLSPLGRMTISALSTLLKFGEDGAELGFLAAQIAGGDAIGSVGQSELQHLLSRLLELKDEFERAILSGSETRIRSAETKLASVWNWVDKGSDVLRRITESTDLDGASHRIAQRIGQVQSELLRMSGAFQRALNQLESQKVHLGATGLSSTDVSAWLRSQTQAQLAKLAGDGATAPIPDFAFALGDIALDIAEFELVDKLRPEKLDAPLPPASEAPLSAGVDMEPPDYAELENWRDALRVAPAGWPLADAVPLRDYELSSYRLSLLALLGDRESATLAGPVADLARLDLRLRWSGEIAPVRRAGVADMSAGYLDQKSRPDETNG
jgi:HAMP domain-containing protein